MFDAFCEQQEEEKRREKIEIWESMQQGKSYKGTAKLSQVSFKFNYCQFVLSHCSLTPSSLSWMHFKLIITFQTELNRIHYVLKKTCPYCFFKLFPRCSPSTRMIKKINNNNNNKLNSFFSPVFLLANNKTEHHCQDAGNQSKHRWCHFFFCHCTVQYSIY